MGSKLITPTLFDAMDWYLKCPPSWKNKAYTDLYNKLNRIWSTNIHVEKGMELEKTAIKWCNKKELKGSEKFQELCTQIQGGEYQVKRKMIVTINNVDYCWYGKLDVCFPSVIVDIKTTGSWKGKSNYLSKWQHEFYCLITGIKFFKYIVVEWTDDYKIKDIHYIDYKVENFDIIKDEITEKTKEFIDFLELYDELKIAYYDKYNLY
jgi:hypothetical protein